MYLELIFMFLSANGSINNFKTELIF